MISFIDHIIGPRVDQSDLEKHGLGYGTPGFLMLVARVLLLVSLVVPFWRLDHIAPQSPVHLPLAD